MTLVQTRADSQLLRRVQDELEWNPRVEATELTARVTHGVVTLSGIVDTTAHKVAAVEAVHQLAGVLDVADN
jgi:osmotically-inducible protein OsmY